MMFMYLLIHVSLLDCVSLFDCRLFALGVFITDGSKAVLLVWGSLLLVIDVSYLELPWAFYIIIRYWVRLLCVQIISSSVKVAECVLSVKRTFSLYLSSCYFNFFPFWFRWPDFGSNCNSSLSLLSFYFSLNYCVF